MIPRKLEPEVMDSAEEARDYDAMDHSAVNRVFVADFLSVWDGRNPILDLGTGTGRIPIELCQRSETARIVAIDLAEHMLQLAEENTRRAGLEYRIHFERRDAKRLPYDPGSFAAVISNSIIHHIPDPGPVVAEAIRVLRPGGLLFLRDLLRPPDETTLASLVDAYAGTANDHQQQLFRDSLHAALTLAEIRDFVASQGFDPADVVQTTDRHWTWTSRKPEQGLSSRQR